MFHVNKYYLYCCSVKYDIWLIYAIYTSLLTSMFNQATWESNNFAFQFAQNETE